jgi:hypothetical protein
MTTAEQIPASEIHKAEVIRLRMNNALQADFSPVTTEQLLFAAVGPD